MKLSPSYRTIAKADPGNAFELAPTSSAVLFPKGFKLADARSNCNDLDCREVPDDFEVHVVIVEDVV